MGVVNIGEKLEMTRQRLEMAARQVDALNPMVKGQVQAVMQPLLLAMLSLAEAVEGVNREL